MASIQLQNTGAAAMFGLLGEMVSAVVISRFQGTLDQLIQLAFFVPVVIAMGGNTGIQSSSIVVRSLALGELSLINLPRRLWVEIK
jgi:magnesium transporter